MFSKLGHYASTARKALGIRLICDDRMNKGKKGSGHGGELVNEHDRGGRSLSGLAEEWVPFEHVFCFLVVAPERPKPLGPLLCRGGVL